MAARRILIADDVAFFRQTLKDLLAGEGFEVVAEASNGAEAVEMTKAHAPDIVLLDVVMPEKNGLEAAREIIRLKLPLKIVMCSSLGYEPIVKEALKAGASAYILKPFDKVSVLKALSSLEKPDAG
ncbi:MAG: response regulator [Deltaproteobacteria bacterium]|nr:response regulator [Deltaproteobacteria bacterium]